MNVVELKILAGSYVRDVVGVFLRQVGHRLELLRVEPPAGNLDALHAGRIPHRVRTLREVAGGIVHFLKCCAVISLAVVVALAVSAAAKPRFGEEPLVNFALLSQRDFSLVDIHLAGEVFRHLSRECLLPKWV